MLHFVALALLLFQLCVSTEFVTCRRQRNAAELDALVKDLGGWHETWSFEGKGFASVDVQY